MPELGRLQAILTADDRDFRAKMKGADGLAKTTARGIRGTFENMRLRLPRVEGGAAGGGILGGLGSIAGGNLLSGAIQTAISGITSAMQSGLSAGLEYNKTIENASISFKTLLGSADAAQKHLQLLQQFSESTPFEFPDLIKASQRMQAMGFAADAIVPSLRSIGDAVAAVGGGKAELDGVVMALGQMQTKGKVSAEEMNQLAERGIPAWDMLAQAIGRTKEETMALSEQGRLRGGRAVEGIVAMMGERFGGQMDEMTRTLAGRESNFQDILNRQLGAATTGTFEELKKGYAKATEGLATEGARVFAGELNSLMTAQAQELQKLLDGISSGQYFKQGAAAITHGRAAADAINRRDLGGAATEGSQALARGMGMEYGSKGEDQIADFMVKQFSRDGVDRAVFGTLVKGITSALMALESVVHKGGKTVGEQTGAGIKEGVQDSLQMRSPSRVMMELGANAAEGFAIGFDNGINATIDRSSEGMKKWAKAIEKAGGEEFLKAVEAMSARLQIDPNKMMNVMAFESRLNPAAKNPKGSATGLIQFLSSTAEDLGTTVAKLKAMNAIEQLAYVEKYFAQFKSLADTQEALYTAVLAGRPVGDPNALLFKEGGKRTGGAYAANRPLDADASGTITAGEATKKVLEQGFLTPARGIITQFDQGVRAFIAALPSLGNLLPRLAGGGIAGPRSGAAGAPPAPIPAVRGGDGAVALPFVDTSRLVTISLEALAVKFRAIPTPAQTAGIALEQLGSQTGKFADAIVEATSSFPTAAERFRDFQGRLGQGFDNLINALITGSDRWQDVAKNIAVDFFNELASEMMLAATGGKHGSLGSLLGGIAGSFFKGLFGFGGGKAGGGSVTGGTPYLVGEKGPELFVPGASGSIVPARETRAMLGGGRSINITINVPVSAPSGTVTPQTRQQIAASTAQAMQAALARNS